MNNFPISILNSGELYTSSTRIHSILTAELATDTYVATICAKLNTGTLDMEKALGKALTSDFTPVLFSIDMERDNGFISLRDFVNSCVHGNDPANVSAAQKIALIIQTIGNSIYTHGYVKETAEMNALIADLSKPEPETWLQTIEATSRFTIMREAQVKFEQAYKAKVDVEAAINYPLLKDSKTRVAQSLNALLTYVESNAEFDKAQFGPIENKINTVITDIVTIARARITRVENEKKKGTDGTAKN